MTKKVLHLFCSLIFILSNHINSQNLLNGPNDIVFDELNNRYLITNWAGNSIVEMDLEGNQSYFRTNVIHAHGMEIKDSILYVASFYHLLLIDINSSLVLQSIFVPESQYLGHIALDSANNVYLSDWSAQKIFKIDVLNQIVDVLITLNFMPVGISYEENNSRLVLLPFVDNASIKAVSLPNGNLSTIKETNINRPDAICRDENTNYYISSFSEGIIYKFDYGFTQDPEIISTGHSEPSGLGYNARDNIIGVTNYNLNRIDFVQLPPTSIDDKYIEPSNYVLFQNYPNPFNPVTTIKYHIPNVETHGHASLQLKIYDILGNEIATLVNEVKRPGNYEVEFSSHSGEVRNLSSGIYFYKLQVGSYFTDTKKMLLIK